MTADNRATEETTTRRVALGAGLIGLAAVAGCSTYGKSDSGGTGGGNGGQPAGTVFAKTSDIPLDGGKVFADQKIVVTQPAQGEFKAFSAICTHQGCTVDAVKDGTIDCPCHGSKFKIADASVAAGPATKPLPPAQITVSGDEIKLA
ncbi:MAG TPA: Rieske (2Fe-2S) protein [Streptosporangiaceae bacterium]|jgi:Rieske Fe-S protein